MPELVVSSRKKLTGRSLHGFHGCSTINAHNRRR
jgi:hypothetical protein